MTYTFIARSGSLRHAISMCPTLATGILNKLRQQGYAPSQVGCISNRLQHRWCIRTRMQAAPQDEAPEPVAAVKGLLATKVQQLPALSALAVLHSTLAAAATLRPQWSLTNLLGLQPSALAASSTVYASEAAAGLLVAAGSHLWLLVSCLMCLKDAAAHDRLSSDTYKRLALGVMYQSVIAAVLFLKNKALCAGSQFGAAAGVFLVTAFVAARIYVSSTGAFSLPVIVKSLISNIKDLFSPRNISSAFYAACALFSLVMFVRHFPTSSSSPILATDCGHAAVFAKQAEAAGMVLAGVVWYTLKDAADRSRLAASTFRQLNLAMAVVAALKLWAYWQLAVAGVPLHTQLWKVAIGVGLLTLAVCDYQFFFARKEVPTS